MEAELLSKLKAGHVTDFWTWLSKQPTKPLNKIFITGQVALSNYRPSCDVPHLFALVHLLTESGTSAEEVRESYHCYSVSLYIHHLLLKFYFTGRKCQVHLQEIYSSWVQHKSNYRHPTIHQEIEERIHPTSPRNRTKKMSGH